jgi:hypothetical protein
VGGSRCDQGEVGGSVASRRAGRSLISARVAWFDDALTSMHLSPSQRGAASASFSVRLASDDGRSGTKIARFPASPSPGPENRARGRCRGCRDGSSHIHLHLVLACESAPALVAGAGARWSGRLLLLLWRLGLLHDERVARVLADRRPRVGPKGRVGQDLRCPQRLGLPVEERRCRKRSI